MSAAERILELSDIAANQFPIYNCSAQASGSAPAACPGTWSNLGPGFVETVRKCGTCERNVYMAREESQVRAYDSLKYAFVVDIATVAQAQQEKTGLLPRFAGMHRVEQRAATPLAQHQKDAYSELADFRSNRQSA